jgi:hypothetical protein
MEIRSFPFSNDEAKRFAKHRVAQILYPTKETEHITQKLIFCAQRLMIYIHLYYYKLQNLL